MVIETFEINDKGKIINRKIEDIITELDNKITLLSNGNSEK